MMFEFDPNDPGTLGRAYCEGYCDVCDQREALTQTRWYVNNQMIANDWICEDCQRELSN